MLKKKEKDIVSPILTKRTKGEKVVFTIVFILFCLYAISLILPFVFVFLSSLKDGFSEYFDENNTVFTLPKKWLFSNYIEAFKKLKYDNGEIQVSFPMMFVNSIWYTLLSSFVSVFSCTVTGYCLSKYQFKARKYIYAIAIFCMTIPIVGTTGSYYKLIGDLGIYDTPLYVVISSISAWGFNFLVMYGFFKNVSWTYAEAAFVDGGGHFTAFFKIMIPLAIGPITTLFVVACISNWNDYMSLIMYMPSYPTIASGLYNYQANSTRIGDMPIYFAGILISIIPVLIMFIFCSNTMMKNMNVGGIKG